MSKWSLKRTSLDYNSFCTSVMQYFGWFWSNLKNKNKQTCRINLHLIKLGLKWEVLINATVKRNMFILIHSSPNRNEWLQSNCRLFPIHRGTKLNLSLCQFRRHTVDSHHTKTSRWKTHTIRGSNCSSFCCSIFKLLFVIKIIIIIKS